MLEAVFTTWTHLFFLPFHRDGGRFTAVTVRRLAEPLITRLSISPKVPLLPIPIGGLLALDTTRRPWHGREAFGLIADSHSMQVPKLPS
jgi:hypothetical protein